MLPGYHPTQARLLEEVEMLQGQKDAVTEMLVRSHQQLEEQALLAEEVRSLAITPVRCWRRG